MDLGTLTRLLALITSVLLTLTTVPVHSRARCRGKWRIHACFGGNGKRSDPRLAGSNQPTLASRLREARHLVLQSAARSNYESKRPLSLLARLQPEPLPSLSQKLLAKELATLLQEDNIPREKEDEPIFRPEDSEETEEDFPTSRDVTDGEEEMTPVDMETVRDIFTALTLQRALRRQDEFGEGNTDARGPIL